MNVLLDSYLIVHNNISHTKHKATRKSGISEHVHGVCFCIEIIVFVLVTYWSEVPENTNSCFCQTHIVPQLLALFSSQALDSLTLHKHLSTNEEVNIMFMFDRMSMKLYSEEIFLLILYVFLFKHNSQSILIHIFIKERSQLIMYDLAASVYIIAIQFELLI